MSDPKSPPPIFVVGVPRSGTTLLSAMLGAHPRLACGAETQFFHFLPEDHDRLLRREDWPGAAIDYLYSIRHFGESIPANYGLTRGELAEALAHREPSIPSILSGMVELYAGRQGKPRWVEKTPEHLPQVDRIRQYYPDSPVVRIIRDPRAVAASLMAVSWGASHMLDALTRWWKSYDDRSASFFETDPLCHTLRYEDLVSRPEPVLREVCRAIGEPFDPAMLDTSRSARQVNAANEPWKDKVAERADASRAEAWRGSLSADDIRLAEAWVGDRIRAYGYPVLGPECPHYVEAYPRSALDIGRAGSFYAERHPRGLLAQCPDVVAELVARGGRFWKLPGEKPALSLFLGHPNWWIGHASETRRARAARIAWTIIRRRLGGVPLAWLEAPDPSEIRGRCARAIARMLPRPTANRGVPDLVHAGDPSWRAAPSGIDDEPLAG